MGWLAAWMAPAWCRFFILNGGGPFNLATAEKVNRRLDPGLSAGFLKCRGLGEGWPLSPMVWNVVVDPLAVAMRRMCPGLPVTARTVGNVSAVLFADDVNSVLPPTLAELGVVDAIAQRFMDYINGKPSASKCGVAVESETDAELINAGVDHGLFFIPFSGSTQAVKVLGGLIGGGGGTSRRVAAMQQLAERRARSALIRHQRRGHGPASGINAVSDAGVASVVHLLSLVPVPRGRLATSINKIARGILELPPWASFRLLADEAVGIIPNVDGRALACVASTALALLNGCGIGDGKRWVEAMILTGSKHTRLATVPGQRGSGIPGTWAHALSQNLAWAQLAIIPGGVPTEALAYEAKGVAFVPATVLGSVERHATVTAVAALEGGRLEVTTSRGEQGRTVVIPQHHFSPIDVSKAWPGHNINLAEALGIGGPELRLALRFVGNVAVASRRREIGDIEVAVAVAETCLTIAVVGDGASAYPGITIVVDRISRQVLPEILTWAKIFAPPEAGAVAVTIAADGNACAPEDMERFTGMVGEAAGTATRRDNFLKRTGGRFARVFAVADDGFLSRVAVVVDAAPNGTPPVTGDEVRLHGLWPEALLVGWESWVLFDLAVRRSVAAPILAYTREVVAGRQRADAARNDHSILAVVQSLYREPRPGVDFGRERRVDHLDFRSLKKFAEKSRLDRQQGGDLLRVWLRLATHSTHAAASRRLITDEAERRCKLCQPAAPPTGVELVLETQDHILFECPHLWDAHERGIVAVNEAVGIRPCPTWVAAVRAGKAPVPRLLWSAMASERERSFYGLHGERDLPASTLLSISDGERRLRLAPARVRWLIERAVASPWDGREAPLFPPAFRPAAVAVELMFDALARCEDDCAACADDPRPKMPPDAVLPTDRRAVPCLAAWTMCLVPSMRDFFIAALLADQHVAECAAVASMAVPVVRSMVPAESRLDGSRVKDLTLGCWSGRRSFVSLLALSGGEGRREIEADMLASLEEADDTTVVWYLRQQSAGDDVGSGDDGRRVVLAVIDNLPLVSARHCAIDEVWRTPTGGRDKWRPSPLPAGTRRVRAELVVVATSGAWAQGAVRWTPLGAIPGVMEGCVAVGAVCHLQLTGARSARHDRPASVSPASYELAVNRLRVRPGGARGGLPDTLPCLCELATLVRATTVIDFPPGDRDASVSFFWSLFLSRAIARTDAVVLVSGGVATDRRCAAAAFVRRDRKGRWKAGSVPLGNRNPSEAEVDTVMTGAMMMGLEDVPLGGGGRVWVMSSRRRWILGLADRAGPDGGEWLWTAASEAGACVSLVVLPPTLVVPPVVYLLECRGAAGREAVSTVVASGARWNDRDAMAQALGVAAERLTPEALENQAVGAVRAALCDHAEFLKITMLESSVARGGSAGPVARLVDRANRLGAPRLVYHGLLPSAVAAIPAAVKVGRRRRGRMKSRRQRRSTDSVTSVAGLCGVMGAARYLLAVHADRVAALQVAPQVDHPP